MKTKQQVIKEIMEETGLNGDFVEAIIYDPSMRGEN